MSLLAAGRRGLTVKLALVFIGLSLATLVLVKWTVTGFESRELVAGIDAGRLARAADEAARDLAQRGPELATADLTDWAETQVLRLERPRGGLTPGESYVLLELGTDAVGIAVLDAGGALRTVAPAALNWRPEPPPRDDPVWRAGTAQALPHHASTQSPRRALAPVRGADGSVTGYVLLEVRLPSAWPRLIGEFDIEWPILVVYLLVFGLGAAVVLVRWVTRRLDHVADAASAWSRGDFSRRIADDSADEVGSLAAQLNRMSLDLESLVRTRGELAKLEERQRLARDLHDTVKQRAFALNLQLNAARRLLERDAPLAKERLEDAASLTHELQRELALLLDDMRTPEPPRPLLGTRLRDAAERWIVPTGLELGLDIDAAVQPASAVADELLRIAEEALVNCLRHAGATRVDVALKRRGERIELSIADNGRGGAEPGAGMGLANMRSRAERLDQGQFALDSAPRRGTIVTVSCRHQETLR